MSSPGPDPDLPSLALQEKKLALKVINQRRGHASLATNLLTTAVHRLEPLATDLMDSAGIACKRGCSWCCKGSRVDVAPHEAIAIAEWMRTHLTPELQHDIRQRVMKAAETARNSTTDERWARQIPCAFLNEQEACDIHPMRPFACRRMNSYDASACERASTSGNGVPSDVRILSLYAVGQVAIERAAHDCRLEAGKYELSNAVEVALRVPDAAARWSEGAQLFEAARTLNDTQDRIVAAEASAAMNPNAPVVSNRSDIIRAATEGGIQPMPAAIEESLLYHSPTLRNRRKRERRGRKT